MKENLLLRYYKLRIYWLGGKLTTTFDRPFYLDGRRCAMALEVDGHCFIGPDEYTVFAMAYDRVIANPGFAADMGL
jgi:hypothetical protein